jgi:AraC family L-rhamnose operon regulatory protein RhaS
MFLVELTRRLGEEWTLDAMARECGLNRTRFSHYCKPITNKKAGPA